MRTDERRGQETCPEEESPLHRAIASGVLVFKLRKWLLESIHLQKRRAFAWPGDDSTFADSVLRHRDVIRRLTVLAYVEALFFLFLAHAKSDGCLDGVPEDERPDQCEHRDRDDTLELRHE